MEGSECGNMEKENRYFLKDFCRILSISTATGRNWIRLGKIIPTGEQDGKPYFSEDDTREILNSLQDKDTKFLKSRRNKKYISGNGMYKSYIPPESVNLPSIEKLLTRLEGCQLTDRQLRALLTECALQLLCQAAGKDWGVTENFLYHYRQKEIKLGEYDELIQDLLAEAEEEQEVLELSEISEAFQVSYVLEKNVDVLGMIYISLKNLGVRKASGAYYTPTHIVKRLTDNLLSGNLLKRDTGYKLLDPCCGTGNFLLQLPDACFMEQIYGRDIDKISVLLARINMALKFPHAPVSLIKKQIRVQDFLLGEDEDHYDCILGNPPWGCEFDQEDRKQLAQTFQTAKGKSVESYDLFLEQALARLKTGGSVAFVLPEAVLNVRSHLKIRKILMENVRIESVDYLGNVFDKVQCPAVVLQLLKTQQPLDIRGMKVFYENRNFQVGISRNVEPENFNFHVTDEEYEILEKIKQQENITYLRNQAEFALGIVTGNNRKYIQDTENGNNEAVVKGADICKYKVGSGACYLAYEPKEFQQAAPEEYYRAKEKLLYRFIGKQLVFAYDDRQRLSLNSCNLVIPHIAHMDMKYIMAVLNSRIAQFIYSRKFHSMKVLRNYLEQIPIPVVSQEEQRKIVRLTEKIMAEGDREKWMEYYEEIDRQIAAAFGLTEEEYAKIHEAEQSAM